MNNRQLQLMNSRKLQEIVGAMKRYGIGSVMATSLLGEEVEIKRGFVFTKYSVMDKYGKKSFFSKRAFKSLNTLTFDNLIEELSSLVINKMLKKHNIEYDELDMMERMEVRQAQDLLKMTNFSIFAIKMLIKKIKN